MNLVTGLPDKIRAAVESITESTRMDNFRQAGIATGIILGGFLQQIGI